jgi:radical SAM protein with 4Fe4S-binding SPASM domain
MPDELLWPLLDDHARMGGDHIYTYGLGEPLMDPRIFDILERCGSLGLGTVLSTNGTLLTEARRQSLVKAHCDHLLIGIDGSSEETYSYYRAGGKFHRVVENVQALAALKKSQGSRMTIVVQFIEMKRNKHEIESFLKQWRDVPGIDQVRIKQEDIGLDAHRTLEVDGHLRQNPCHLLWRGPPVVRYTGDVFACYHHAEHGKPVGNLQSTPLSELWDSAPMQRLRKLHTHNEAGKDPQCASCPAARPKLPFVLGAMALRGTTVRKLVPVAERIALRYPKLFSEPRQPL